MKKMAIEKLDSPFLLSDGMIRQFLHHNTASAILLKTELTSRVFDTLVL